MRSRGERDELDFRSSVCVKDSSIRLFRLLSFLIIFMVGVIIGLTSSSHVDRYFNIQADQFYGSQAFALAPEGTVDSKCDDEQNCIKVDALTMTNFISPKTLAHSMSDEELFWRASMVPKKAEFPYSRVPKVAFMYLTRGPLPLLPLWERFFQGQNEKLFSIYVHAQPGYELNVINNSVFYRRQIPSQLGQAMFSGEIIALGLYANGRDEMTPVYGKRVLYTLLGLIGRNRTVEDLLGVLVLERSLDENYKVKWGSVSLFDAERRLLANALLDFSNERFILLSESCIPVYNFPTVYKYLTESLHSFVQSYDDPSRYGRGRYSRHMKPAIHLADWRKGSQWFELNRTLAVDIVADTRYYTVFKKYCKPACYPDEHYIPTFVHMFHGPLNSNRTVTYVDWSLGGPHPATFEAVNVTEGFIESIRNNGTQCWYNFETTYICSLFARKFAPSALEPLLGLASGVMDF
ncbi:hypothetical protein LguiB_006595 [Lonicera macranthoides]